jgi:hypothetical protein
LVREALGYAPSGDDFTSAEVEKINSKFLAMNLLANGPAVRAW